MSLPWIWFGLAALALVGEVLTGTFYLLVIAAAFVLAGGAAFLGLTVALQLAVCAVAAIAGVLVLRRVGVLRKGRNDATTNADVNLDIGQPVQVDAWRADGTARVRYRGADWDVSLVPGATPAPGQYVIVEVRSNHLVLGPRR